MTDAVADCEGKVAHDSAAAAHAQASRMTRKKKAPLVAYRCDVCGKWHVGSRPRMPDPRLRGGMQARRQG